MATIINRSRLVVRVHSRPELTREFPFDQRKAARQYLRELQAQKLTAVLDQYETNILVRIRRKGTETQNIQTSSYEEAEKLILSIESERSRGLFIDYTRSARVTMAELIVRYIFDECPQHKGAKIETNVLRGLLEDSGCTETTRDAVDRLVERLPPRRPSTRPRTRRTHLAWLHLPFAELVPTHIEEYKAARGTQVKPATVDRELDLIAQVINVAIDTWRYPVLKSPMDGVRRPTYCNERDRRLVGDECVRLLEAAREEDRLRSKELAIQARLVDVRREARSARSEGTRKRRIAEARRRISDEIGESYEVIPLYEAKIAFLIETAARRSEAHRLTWSHVRLDARTAHFPETKNGHPRTVPVPACTASLLAELARVSERVFPISEDAFDSAWVRICERAGIEDFRPHDLRHEGLSRIAEAGHRAGQHFSLIDLAAISGHRDLRMLARYSNLCASHLAERLDAIFKDSGTGLGQLHKGRHRLGGKSGVTVKEVLDPPPPPPVKRHPATRLPGTASASSRGPAEPRSAPVAGGREVTIDSDGYNTLPV